MPFTVCALSVLAATPVCTAPPPPKLVDFTAHDWEHLCEHCLEHCQLLAPILTSFLRHSAVNIVGIIRDGNWLPFSPSANQMLYRSVTPTEDSTMR